MRRVENALQVFIFLLTCAFTQSCFEALQETVEEQFSSGQTGCWSRRTVTQSALAGRLSWAAAAQQWTDGKMSFDRLYMQELTSSSDCLLTVCKLFYNN